MITRSKVSRYQLVENTRDKSLTINFGNGNGIVKYDLNDNIYVLYDSYIPEKFRGKGYGRILATVSCIQILGYV